MCVPIEGRVIALSFDDTSSREGDRMVELFDDATLGGTGPCGVALQLGPGGGWADVANDAELQAVFAGRFTMMAWVRSSQAPVPAVYPHVISKEQSTAPRHGINLILHGNPIDPVDTVLFEARNAGELFQVRGSAVNDDEWHHVAGVRDAEVIAVYVDGVRVAERPVSDSVFDDDLPLRIGAKSRYDAEAPILTSLLEGAIDEVRIYAVALSDTDVALIFEEQTAGRCACP